MVASFAKAKLAVSIFCLGRKCRRHLLTGGMNDALLIVLKFQIGSLENYYLFEHHGVSRRSVKQSSRHHNKLHSDPQVSKLICVLFGSFGLSTKWPDTIMLCPSCVIVIGIVLHWHQCCCLCTPPPGTWLD